MLGFFEATKAWPEPALVLCVCFRSCVFNRRKIFLNIYQPELLERSVYCLVDHAVFFLDWSHWAFCLCGCSACMFPAATQVVLCGVSLRCCGRCRQGMLTSVVEWVSKAVSTGKSPDGVSGARCASQTRSLSAFAVMTWEAHGEVRQGWWDGAEEALCLEVSLCQSWERMCAQLCGGWCLLVLRLPSGSELGLLPLCSSTCHLGRRAQICEHQLWRSRAKSELCF